MSEKPQPCDNYALSSCFKFNRDCTYPDCDDYVYTEKEPESTKFRIVFDMKLFKEDWRPHVAKYMRGEIPANVAAQRIGITREVWERHMAGIFSNALKRIIVEEDPSGFGIPYLASIEEVKE